jgi:hypothetical protein
MLIYECKIMGQIDSIDCFDCFKKHESGEKQDKRIVEPSRPSCVSANVTRKSHKI